MECPKCNVQNDKLKKFCRLCGTPLGIYCDRCGTVNAIEDKFCGTCGLALLPSTVDEIPISGSQQNIPRQYNPLEIEELLTLRIKLEKEKEVSQTFSQDDIDNLFQ